MPSAQQKKPALKAGFPTKNNPRSTFRSAIIFPLKIRLFAALLFSRPFPASHAVNFCSHLNLHLAAQAFHAFIRRQSNPALDTATKSVDFVIISATYKNIGKLNIELRPAYFNKKLRKARLSLRNYGCTTGKGRLTAWRQNGAIYDWTKIHLACARMLASGKFNSKESCACAN